MMVNQEEINNLMDEFVESVESRSGLKVKASYRTTSGKQLENICSHTDFIDDLELDYMDVNVFLNAMDQYIENKNICSLEELDMGFIDNASQLYNISSNMLLNLMASSIASRPLDYEYELLDTIQEKIGQGMDVELFLSMDN